MPAIANSRSASTRPVRKAGGSPTSPDCRTASPPPASKPWPRATRSPPAAPPTTASRSIPTAMPANPSSSRVLAPAPRSPPPRSSTTPWRCRSDARVATCIGTRAVGGFSRRERRSYRGSAFDDVDGQAAARGFLVLVAHVAAGVAHGLDDLVEADLVLAVAAHRHARGVDCLHRPHGVAFDARDLHQAADRVAGQPEVVLHADLG